MPHLRLCLLCTTSVRTTCQQGEAFLPLYKLHTFFLKTTHRQAKLHLTSQYVAYNGIYSAYQKRNGEAFLSRYRLYSTCRQTVCRQNMSFPPSHRLNTTTAGLFWSAYTVYTGHIENRKQQKCEVGQIPFCHHTDYKMAVQRIHVESTTHHIPVRMQNIF